jgi:hypothetical protein
LQRKKLVRKLIRHDSVGSVRLVRHEKHKRLPIVAGVLMKKKINVGVKEKKMIAVAQAPAHLILATALTLAPVLITVLVGHLVAALTLVVASVVVILVVVALLPTGNSG